MVMEKGTLVKFTYNGQEMYGTIVDSITFNGKTRYGVRSNGWTYNVWPNMKIQEVKDGLD